MAAIGNNLRRAAAEEVNEPQTSLTSEGEGKEGERAFRPPPQPNSTPLLPIAEGRPRDHTSSLGCFRVEKNG